MRRPTASGLGFAVARGGPIDLDRVVHLDPPRPHRPGARRLLVVVEPLDPTDRGHDVAAVALAALREGFWGAARQPLAFALGEAFAAANAAVRDENRLCPGEGRDRRAGVGATAIALEGRQLVLAQVPPSQAVLVQEGQVYAFPDVGSWSGFGGVAAESGGCGVRIAPDPEPLGYHERANPDLFRTLAAPDDLIVLCASAIPSCTTVGDRGDGRDGSVASFGELLAAAEPDAVVARLGGVVEAYGLEHAHAACCTVGRLHTLDAALARETVARLALAWGAGPAASRRAARAAAPPRQRGRTASRGSALAPGAGRRRRSFAGVGLALDGDDPDPGLDPEGEDQHVAPASVIVVPAEPARPRPQPRGGETGSVVGHRPLAVVEGPIGVLDDPLEALLLPGAPRASGPGAAPATTGPVPRSFGEGLYVVAHPRRADALDALHLRATVLGERVAPRRVRPEPRAGRAVAAVSPGALGLERYRGPGALDLPGGWRLSVPDRGHGLRRAAIALCLALLLVAGGAGAFGSGPMTGAAERAGVTALAARLPFPAWTGLENPARNPAATALTEVDGRLAAAAASTDPALVGAELDLAEASLAVAITAGAGGESLAARQAALTAARDRAAGIVRLPAPVLIGDVEAGPESPATLVLAGSDLYVAGVALYRLDGGGDDLSRLAGAGDRLGDAAIGAMRGAAGEDAGLVVTDGLALFRQDAGGTWSTRTLPAPEEVAVWPVAPAGAFGGNFYLLEAETGRILKFAGDDPAAAPRDWTAGANAEDLRTARDMVVDGRIHVLLADGRILTFLRGELERTYALPADISVADPVALHAGPDGRSLYLLDRGDGTGSGRLYRIDRESGAAHELVLDDDLDGPNGLLAGARDVAVDEELGRVFLLTADGLWRTQIPPAKPTDA